MKKAAPARNPSSAPLRSGLAVRGRQMAIVIRATATGARGHQPTGGKARVSSRPPATAAPAGHARRSGRRSRPPDCFRSLPLAGPLAGPQAGPLAEPLAGPPPVPPPVPGSCGAPCDTPAPSVTMLLLGAGRPASRPASSGVVRRALASTQARYPLLEHIALRIRRLFDAVTLPGNTGVSLSQAAARRAGDHQRGVASGPARARAYPAPDHCVTGTEKGPSIPSDRNTSRRQRARIPLSTGCPDPLRVQPPAQPGPPHGQPPCSAPGKKRRYGLGAPRPWRSPRSGRYSRPGRLARCWTGQQLTAPRPDVNLASDHSDIVIFAVSGRTSAVIPLGSAAGRQPHFLGATGPAFSGARGLASGEIGQ
jgi:hypothetical protein